MSTGISSNPFRAISRNQVQGISCNPFQGNSHNSIQGISCNQFQGISCYQFWRKTRENIDKICGNSWEFPEKSSLEPIPGNFLGIIPKIFSRISWNILSKFLSKFTNQDLGSIIVNTLTTILPLQLFRSIFLSIFLSQNVFVVLILLKFSCILFIQTTEISRKKIRNIPEKFWEISWEKLQRNSQEFLETYSLI